MTSSTETKVLITDSTHRILLAVCETILDRDMPGWTTGDMQKIQFALNELKSRYSDNLSEDKF